jgi:hypothetical protein
MMKQAAEPIQGLFLAGDDSYIFLMPHIKIPEGAMI